MEIDSTVKQKDTKISELLSDLWIDVNIKNIACSDLFKKNSIIILLFVSFFNVLFLLMIRDTDFLI
jgi:hypothetical protein